MGVACGYARLAAERDTHLKLHLPLVIVMAIGLAEPAFAEPPKPTHSTDAAHCSWVWQTGAGLGVWTEKCAFQTGLWQLKFDPADAGFSLFVDDDNSGLVLAAFAKPADAGIAAILPELSKRGLIPDDDECIFRPASAATLATVGRAPKTRAFFEIMPVGKRKAALDATPSDEVPDAPCGDAGWAPDGVSLFMTDATHPTGVVYMNLGQDGTMFDPSTVTWQ